MVKKTRALCTVAVLFFTEKSGPPIYGSGTFCAWGVARCLFVVFLWLLLLLLFPHLGGVCVFVVINLSVQLMNH